MRLHPVVASLLATGGTAMLAFGLALWLPIDGLGAAGAALVLAAVIAALFAWRPTDGLMAFGIVVLVAETVTYWTDADLRYADEASLALFAMVAVAVHRRRLSIPTAGWREAALGTLIVAGVASSLMNSVPATVWIPGLLLLAKGFAFFYLVTSLPVDSDDVNRVMACLFTVGLVIVAFGFVQFLAPDLATSLGAPPYPERRGSLQVVNSLFTQPSLYGWLAIVLSLFLFARSAVRREWWSVPLALLLGGASVLSGRRIPLVGWLVAVVVGAIRQSAWRGASARIWVIIAAGALGVVLASLPVLGSFYRETVEDYFGTAGAIGEVFAQDPDPAVVRPLHPRVALYAGSMAVARDAFPLGAGMGRFGSHMSRETYSPVYAAYGLDQVYGLRERRPIAITDTFWPMILGEAGVIGLIAAAAFFALLGRDLWRAAAPVGSVIGRVFTLGALLVYVEALVRSTISGVFVAPPIAYWVFGAAALSLALRRHEAATSAPPNAVAAPRAAPR